MIASYPDVVMQTLTEVFVGDVMVPQWHEMRGSLRSLAMVSKTKATRCLRRMCCACRMICSSRVSLSAISSRSFLEAALKA